MSAFFDEKKLKEVLSNMDGTEREKFVNGALDLASLTKLKIRNADLTTEAQNLGQAITQIGTTPPPSQIKSEIQKYFQPIAECFTQQWHIAMDTAARSA